MTSAEAKRVMGVGNGTLAQKRLTHQDPFEPEQPKPVEPEQDKTYWGQTVDQWKKSAGHP